MEFSPELLKQFAAMCGIPIISATQHVWIVRTKGGRYYQDFSRNGYIALGWDKIPLRWITDENRTKQDVIESIKDEYPDEKRPGLIYGQLVDFVRIMTAGDYVVIPSEGSNYVNIGVIGELFSDTPAAQILLEDDYLRCGYHLRRSVVWQREVSVTEDIYLSKMLRAQQTISDITKYADLVFRNLHDLYFIDGTLSLTLRKTNDTATALSDEVQLLMAIDETVKRVSSFMGDDELVRIERKSAMSSPGFLQFILTNVSNFTPVLVFQQIFKTVGGKIKSADGKEIAQGLPAVMYAISNLCNDKADRDVKRAQARKLDAEAKKEEAAARKLDAEAQAMDLQNIAALLALGEKLTDGAEDAASMLASKRIESSRIDAEIEQCKKQLAPVMERMGIQVPQIELPKNVILFPIKRDD